MAKERTINVRVAVAVNGEGHWNAAGWDSPCSAAARAYAKDPLDSVLRVYWLTATLPVPEPVDAPATIAATVED